MRRPSTSTVQAPHWPRSQPFLVPVRPRRSRSASSSVTRGSSLQFVPYAVHPEADRAHARGGNRRRCCCSGAAALRCGERCRKACGHTAGRLQETASRHAARAAPARGRRPAVLLFELGLNMPRLRQTPYLRRSGAIASPRPARRACRDRAPFEDRVGRKVGVREIWSRWQEAERASRKSACAAQVFRSARRRGKYGSRSLWNCGRTVSLPGDCRLL